MKYFALAFAFGLCTSAGAATIAVIDSGLDYQHEMISPNLWTNPAPTNKGPYRNVQHGWNFAEKNNEIIDYRLLNTFSPDLLMFYEIQSKAYLFTATAEEKSWVDLKRADKEFMKEADIFGDFVHGTHVAGIAVKGSGNKVMGVKLLPTRVRTTTALTTKGRDNDPWNLLNRLFSVVSKNRMESLAEVARFLADHRVDVANGSFGTGLFQAAGLAFQYFEMIFKRKPQDDELLRASIMFLRNLNLEAKGFMDAAPNTLFVFAAGNDNISNDLVPTSPASVMAANSISVAATFEDKFFAPFSNHGVMSVDVAAPGMAIESSIPGNGYLRISGTSQAAPFVANVAGRIKDANRRLSPADIKRILMETVDKKPFLATRVASKGIVNAARAVSAARSSVTMGLTEAIEKARSEVGVTKSFLGAVPRLEDFRYIPITPMFILE